MVGVSTPPYQPSKASQAACRHLYHRDLVPQMVAVFHLHVAGLFQELASTAFSGAEGKSEQRKTTIFICPFIKQELLHDNLIQ